MVRRLLGLSVVALLLMAAWAVIAYAAVVDGWLRTPLVASDDPLEFADAVRNAIEAEHRGNVAFVLLHDGEVVAEHYVSTDRPVDRDSLFQVASLSKWVSAWGVLALVDAGRLSLDAPVDTYLSRWQLPPGDFDNRGVTVRRLLSHTAGLTDGLGYGGFAPGVPIQPLEDSLTQAADASPGADGRVRVGLQPGTEWRYSGGGYTLLQLLVEETSGQAFTAFMREAVFEPLGMQRTTFELRDGTPNVAQILAPDGTEAVRYRFAGLAPTGLYTSAADMTRFLLANVTRGSAAPAGRGVLETKTLESMWHPHGRSFGADIWGLGTMLYAPMPEGGFVIGHDGSNEPAINAAVRLAPERGAGIVILETGNPLLATHLAGEWVFWLTGTVDFLDFTALANGLVLGVILGWLVIAVVVVVFAVARRNGRGSR